MEQHWMNLLLFIGILIGAYLIFRYVKFDNVKEGLDNNTSPTNGIAGNASTYNTNLQAEVTKLSDTLSIKAYRKDYENIILTLDDAINFNLLNTLLSMNPDQLLSSGPITLYISSQSRVGLNNLVKFIDKQ
jgi:hypothetical protein